MYRTDSPAQIAPAQHDASTPVERLYLTPRRTRMLLALLVRPQAGYQEALVYFARVGIVRRNEHGHAELTAPRGRELAMRIEACCPLHQETR